MKIEKRDEGGAGNEEERVKEDRILDIGKRRRLLRKRRRGRD